MLMASIKLRLYSAKRREEDSLYCSKLGDMRLYRLERK
jgi:hypothetical protein